MFKDTIGKIKEFFKVNIAVLFFAVAVILASISLFVTPQSTSLGSQADKVEKIVQKRQQILEGYAKRALNVPASQWLSFEDFPSDMVIYRYNADTLQSWVNQFPISNDEVDLDVSTYMSMYRIHYMDSRNQFDSPFAYLTVNEQYVNLGSSWYVVRVYAKGSTKVIAGLLIKTDSQISDATGLSTINPRLKLSSKMDILPVNFDDGAIVKGKDGGVLFAVVEDVTSRGAFSVSPLLWIALVFALFAVFAFLYRGRSLKNFLIFVAGLTLLRILCFQFGGYVRLDSEFFSPTLYADTGIFSSLGNLLLNNLYVFLVVLGIYMLRKESLSYVKMRGGWKKLGVLVPLAILPIILFIYINITLRSLINNSSIVLELYRITQLNFYSVLCYLSYALLFLDLLFSLQNAAKLLGVRRNYYLLSMRNILLFIFAASLYTLLTTTYLSFKKECEWSKVVTNKLSVERDLGLELELRSIEMKLAKDPLSAIILNLPKENLKLLEQRFSELYFQNIKQKYLISLTICRQNDVLQLPQLVDCMQYYSALLAQYDAVPIADGSNFFYLSNYNGMVGYLGVLKYITENGPVNLYIEIHSRFEDEPSGYPNELFDYQSQDNLNVPSEYSYAKYYKGRLTLYKGTYNYPVTAAKYKAKGSFTVVKRDNCLHFINQVSDNNIVVISRPKRSFFPYLVSFSYLMLFYCAVFLFVLRVRRARLRAVSRFRGPKKSLRRKMTYLLTTAMVIALIAMALGTVWFSINYYNGSNRLHMEEKIQTVQKTLHTYCAYAQNYTDINSGDLFQGMDRLANDTQADINLYDPHGKLIRSTKPELFERFILSSRMNSRAYSELVLKARSQVLNKEKVGTFHYYSLYAPIFNSNGKLIAIANIPYFTKATSLRGDLSSVVAAIINVYILLLIIAIFFGTVLSNSVTRPLAKISGKMQFIDVSKNPEHINYKSEDELGLLVGAYNKMVDSLAESTKQMAQTERERAWSEMARRIAHEIKNPLTPMKLSIQRLIMLKKKNAPGWEEKFEDTGNSILEQIDILSNTASEFSSFAKFFVEDNSVVNLYEVIREQKILFDTQDNIRISFGYDSEGCNVYARRGQIVRVLVNLISNAIQALEKVSETGKGFIRISLQDKGDDYVVAVEDNGDGVKAEDLQKLFTPNFTTKSSGNGLGLAISKSIIEQSGGKIWYSKSELGGASFAFSLPKYKG